MPQKRRTWIAWERQRRSVTLAERVGADLELIIDNRPGWLRYPSSIAKTRALLASRRGEVVFVQNPSMILAAYACFVRRRYGIKLVVDRHSNFSHLAGAGASWRVRVSDLLSNYTLRNADMTIVTNDELAEFVRRAGGRPFVLPDPFPVLGVVPTVARAGAKRPLEVMFVSSWAPDEPIAETIEACRLLEGEAVVHITGRMKPAYAELMSHAPPNFRSTGFLSEADYALLMARCDIVMAVTSRDATLVCGGYEGAVMGKPLLLGNSASLRAYFNRGAVYTDGTAPDIATKIRLLGESLPQYQREIIEFVGEREPEWDERLAALEKEIDD